MLFSEKKDEKDGKDGKEIKNYDQCPLDIRELVLMYFNKYSTTGNSAWKVLHTVAAYYPDEPTCCDKAEIETFFRIFAKYYPCSICAEDFQKDLESMPPETDSAEKLSLWLCRLHNRVNVKLGKPVFDCNLVFERWRDGWKDGSCD